MRFIELFAGIGGFRYGLEAIDRKTNGRSEITETQGGSEGYQELEGIDAQGRQLGEYDNRGNARQKSFACVYANEWDKYAATIYEKNFGERPDTRDITTVLTGDIPDHDLLVGGFPCQAFSIAGKRLGFEDTRGTLFFEIARILRDKRPKYFILENVKGLLSHENGKTFQTILEVLTDIGYILQSEVLNSKNFGVPQNRERVYIVGHLRGQCRPEVFPVREDEPIPNGQVSTGQGRTQTEISTTVRGGNMKADHTFIISRDGKPKNKDIASTLSVGGHGSGNHSDMDLIMVGSLNSETWLKRHESTRRIYSTDGVSPTIPTGMGGGVMTKIQQKNLSIRRLTPIECERLQGFPDNWTEGISDTQRYKCLGNALTTHIPEYIGREILYSYYCK